MSRFYCLGFLVVALFLAGCSASIPIRPWMFIQHESPKPMTEPAPTAAPAEDLRDEVLPS